LKKAVEKRKKVALDSNEIVVSVGTSRHTMGGPKGSIPFWHSFLSPEPDMKSFALPLALLAVACLLFLALSFRRAYAGASSDSRENFKVSVYVVAGDVEKMKDRAWLEAQWARVTDGLKVDKVYLETYREEVRADQEAIDDAKSFFKEKGVETAGGIATCLTGYPSFISLCYTDPADRKKIQDVVEFTAKNFDEIIMDDFFFNNTKYPSDIRAKGEKSWTRFRLDLMAEVSKDVLVGPAKRVNPKVKMVIKYPNWYEHFPNCGYNLEDEPKIFDGIYTGTETRDGEHTDQHLQPYLGYDLMLYLENIKPGCNGGGWVDPYGWRDKERYGEQLWLTLFARAREITLFNFHDIQNPMKAGPHSPVKGSLTAYVGSVFQKVDGFVGKLGKPIGLLSYKPFHSSGEDFLNDFLGTAGIPVEMTPNFPTDAPMVLLTASSAFDPAIVDKIKGNLLKGEKVVVTSGLLKALGHRFDEIAEVECYDRKALSGEFNIIKGGTFKSEGDILIPQVRYPTNDVWEIATAQTHGVAYPLLLRCPYDKTNLYVLTIPDDFADLYRLPVEILDKIRETIAGDLPVRLEGPTKVGLFVYDNHSFILDNFAAPGGKTASVRAVLDSKFTKLTDLVSGEIVSGESEKGKTVFSLNLAPATYRVFLAE